MLSRYLCIYVGEVCDLRGCGNPISHLHHLENWVLLGLTKAKIYVVSPAFVSIHGPTATVSRWGCRRTPRAQWQPCTWLTGSGFAFRRFHSRKLPCQVGEDEDKDEESEIGVGPHRIDLVVELILSDAWGVAKKIVGEKRLGGSDFFEEAITAEEERGDLKEGILLLILGFKSSEDI